MADLGCGTGMLGIGAALMGAGLVVGFDVDPAALEIAARNAEAVGVEPQMEFVLCDVLRLPPATAGKLAGAAGGAATATDSKPQPREAGQPIDCQGDDSRALAPHGGAGAELAHAGASAAHRDGVNADGALSSAMRTKASLMSQDDGSIAESAAAVVGFPPCYRGMFDTVIMNPPFGTRRAGADTAFLRVALALCHADGRVYSLHKSSTRAHFVRTAESLGIGCQLVAQLRFEIPAMYEFHREASVDVDVDLLRFVKGVGAADVRAGHERIPLYVPPSDGTTGGSGKTGRATATAGGSSSSRRGTRAGAHRQDSRANRAGGGRRRP